MTYDHWKTTEPQPSEDLRQCFFCKRQFPLRQIFLCDDDVWICAGCLDERAEEEP